MPRPVRLMVLRYCLGMIASVSTLIILSGAATPSSVVNLSMKRVLEPAERLLMTARPARVKPCAAAASGPFVMHFWRFGPPDIVPQNPAASRGNRRERNVTMLAEPTRTISVTNLHPAIGAEIRGVDLSRQLDADTARQIRDA